MTSSVSWQVFILFAAKGIVSKGVAGVGGSERRCVKLGGVQSLATVSLLFAIVPSSACAHKMFVLVLLLGLERIMSLRLPFAKFFGDRIHAFMVCSKLI